MTVKDFVVGSDPQVQQAYGQVCVASESDEKVDEEEKSDEDPKNTGTEKEGELEETGNT